MEADILTKPIIKPDYWLRARLNTSLAFRSEVKWTHAETPIAAAPPTDRPRNFIIEYCCGDESKIGKGVKPGCGNFRLTIKHDLTTEAGYKHAQNCFRIAMKLGGSILLWVAIPCTGGSPWQNFNKQFPNARILIEQHLRVYTALFNNLIRLTAWVRGLQVNGEAQPNFSFFTAMEWP
jgi:hypothetical protein